jgi:hypothetical protein
VHAILTPGKNIISFNADAYRPAGRPAVFRRARSHLLTRGLSRAWISLANTRSNRGLQMRDLSQELESKQQKRVATLLAIAQLGYAHWFFGNLYEALVGIPERIANDYEPGKDDRRLATVFSSGSPYATIFLGFRS